MLHQIGKRLHVLFGLSIKASLGNILSFFGMVVWWSMSKRTWDDQGLWHFSKGPFTELHCLIKQSWSKVLILLLATLFIDQVVSIGEINPLVYKVK